MVRLTRMSTLLLKSPLGYKAWADNQSEEIESAVTNVEAAQAAADAAIADINEILDDNNLTPDKKSPWIFIHSFLTSEQAGLDSQATSYGITTEKTNYDNAISALTTYLGTLTSPVAWNNVSGNTTIVATTFRSKFNDVLTTKQALINAITAKAKVLADAAQADADQAALDAAAADAAADAAQSDATAAAREEARINSYPLPSSVLTASDAGSTATISIAAHTRVYPVQGSIDVPDLSVGSGSITGLSFSTKYYVYYDDTTLADTTPSYLATTTASTAQVGAAAGRHLVGVITTPADGGSGTSGEGPLPPGGGGDGTQIP